MDKFPTREILTCPKCQGTAFEFVWTIENEGHRTSLLYCHDGFGLQLEDAVQKCVKCDNTEDFKIVIDRQL